MRHSKAWSRREIRATSSRLGRPPMSIRPMLASSRRMANAAPGAQKDDRIAAVGSRINIGGLLITSTAGAHIMVANIHRGGSQGRGRMSYVPPAVASALAALLLSTGTARAAEQQYQMHFLAVSCFIGPCPDWQVTDARTGEKFVAVV